MLHKSTGSDREKFFIKELAPEQSKIKVIVDDDEDAQSGVIEGYASVFDNVDSVNEIVVKGAFTKTLKERLKKGMIKLFDSHKVYDGTQAVIGIVEDAKEDDYGLWFRARFSSVGRAQDIRTKVKEGILTALSFGYDVLKDQVDEVKKVRYLKELRLHEISIVAWGANPKAAIDAVKSDGDDDDAIEDKTELVEDPPVVEPVIEPIALPLVADVKAYQSALTLRRLAADLAKRITLIKSAVQQS
jgi:hypothetical protein